MSYCHDDDDYNEKQRELAVKIAAYFISKGSCSRDSAIEKAKDYLKEQKEIPGCEESNSELDALAKKHGVPPYSDLNTRQAQAIAKDIDDMVDYP